MPHLHLSIRSPIAALTQRLGVCAIAMLSMAAATASFAASDPCDGVPTCRNLGPFTATVVKVNVTRQDRVTAHQGVRTTVRFTNIGNRPLILGYRDHSSSVSDNNGLAYRWSSKAEGIGLVSGGSADAQFQLAPGESREASFEGVLQYNMRRQVAGTVFSHDITIVQLARPDGQHVREIRDHVLSFSNLTASSGFAAARTLPAPSAEPGSPPGAPPPMPATAGADACTDPGTCQAAGPIVASVVRVNVTRSGNVTAYQTVRTTVRFRNASNEPLILAYKQGSGSLNDETGLSYRKAFKAYGIGLVERGAADPQFRLEPGESREAAFEATLQFDVRGRSPGHVYSQDITIDQLAIAGPSQVRTQHEYALSFSNLTAADDVAGGTAAPALNKVVDLFKGLKR